MPETTVIQVCSSWICDYFLKGNNKYFRFILLCAVVWFSVILFYVMPSILMAISYIFSLLSCADTDVSNFSSWFVEYVNVNCGYRTISLDALKIEKKKKTKIHKRQHLWEKWKCQSDALSKKQSTIIFFVKVH